MHMQMSLIIPTSFTLNSLAPLISQTSLFRRLLFISCFPYYLHYLTFAPKA